MRQFSLIDIFDNVLPSLRYDLREEQEYMARFVETAIRTKKVLLAEAGVGTGKTFAYLIPALLHYNFQTDMLKHIMIISTNTIILQNQLIEDIYRIIDILKLDLDPEKLVLAKGKNNFVCPERGLRNKELISKEILEWALSTKTGDRNELLECSDKTWQLININEESDCSHCNNNNHCYYVNLRNRWKTARIIVTNHQQLLADAINRESSPSMPLFSLPSIIIIDEAHRFEDAALQMLSTSFCFNDIKILPRLVKNLEQQLMYILKGTAKLEQLGDDLIDGLKKAIEWDDEESGRAFVKKNDSLHYLIEQYLDIMQSVSEGLTLASTERYKNRQLDMIMDRLPETLEAIISPQKYVCWAEIKNYRIHNFAAISRDYPHKLYELLWKEKRPIVFTSATMTGVNPKDYSYLIETLGINDHIAMKAVASPFDLKKQRIVYLPTKEIMPDNDAENFLNFVSDEINRLINITKGRTLILFTSHKDLKTVANILKQTGSGYNFLIQGDKPQESLVNSFKETKNSVLLGTAFWEGLDIPGENLISIICVKLPFPPPDPILKDREEKAELKGLKPFETIYFPIMITKLKQGLGRLIRKKDDFGVVTIIDKRAHLNEKKYSSEVHEVLKPSLITSDLNIVSDFIGSWVGKRDENY